MHSQSMVASSAISIMPLGNQLTMSSREIAELTDKRHSDVKRDISNMFEQLKVDARNFAHIYVDTMNREQSEYLLSKKYVECLLTGYSIPLRMRVIERLHQLEQQKHIIMPNFSDPAEAAIAWAEQYKKSKQLEDKIEHDAPKVAFVENYVVANGSLGFRQVSKVLKIKETDFRLFLIENGIMYYLGGVLTPYQKHIDARRFEVKVGNSAINSHAYSQAKFTPKGIQWIAGLLAVNQLK